MYDMTMPVSSFRGLESLAPLDQLFIKQEVSLIEGFYKISL